MNKIRLILLISLLFICSLLVACSSDQENEASGNASGESKNGSGQVELTYIAQGEWDETGLQDVIDAFEEENPNITIKLEMHPFRNLFETIETRMTTESDDFDILAVDGPLVANYSVKRYLEPLDDYMDPNVTSNWVESSVNASTYEGQLMAAPMNTSSQLLFYNKDMFDEKGIEYPKMDVEERWTWEETVEAARQLTSEEVYGFSFHQVNRPYQLLPLAQGLGAEVISEDGLTASGYTNSQEMIEASQFYQDLFVQDSVHPYITADESQDYFIAGNTAMIISGTWLLNSLENEADFEYGIAPHPYFEEGEAVTPTGSWHVGVSSYSNHKEEAAKFVEYLTAGEGAQIWFEGNRDVPAHVDILEHIENDEEFEEFPNNAYRLTSHEAQETAISRPVSPGYLEWESLLDRAFSDIANGDDPKEVLDEIVVEMDRRLSQYQQ